MGGYTILLIFSVIGVGMSFFPKRLQSLHLWAIEKADAPINPFIGYIKSKQYVVLLRVIGLLTLSSTIMILMFSLFK